jgi:hypothetical protein
MRDGPTRVVRIVVVMRDAVAALALLGCGTSAAPPPRAEPPPAPKGVAPRVAPKATPREPEAQRLPPFAQAPITSWLDGLAPILVSPGGELVAVSVGYSDGARNAPNFFVHILDPDTDTAVHSVAIRPPDRDLEPRLEPGRARAELLLAQRRWSPLTAYELADDPHQAPGWLVEYYGPRKLARGEDLVVRYDEPLLTVATTGGKTLVQKRVTAWSDVDDPPCAVDEQCHRCSAAPATLGMVWGSRADRVLVVMVDYHSFADVCWERDETYHAVRLP